MGCDAPIASDVRILRLGRALRIYWFTVPTSGVTCSSVVRLIYNRWLCGFIVTFSGGGRCRTRRLPLKSAHNSDNYFVKHVMGCACRYMMMIRRRCAVTANEIRIRIWASGAATARPMYYSRACVCCLIKTRVFIDELISLHLHIYVI